MANIRETLTLEDRFSANFTRYIQMGQQAAGASDLASASARNYQSVANSLDRQLIVLNSQFAVMAQNQQALVDAGQEGSAAFQRLEEEMNTLGGRIRNVQTQYSLVVSEMEQAQSAAANAATATDELAESQNRASTSSNSLIRQLKNLFGAYIGIQGIKSLFNLSDTFASNTARLNMMNDGLLTTEELTDRIYEAAQRSRGSYQATTDMVAKLGTLAGNAFSSTSEIVDFAEQLNKQIALSGASTQAAEAAMLQLTQAMSSGLLRGEELNSILEQTPTIAQTIADYMGVTTGKMRELASEGAITGEVVKNALLSAAGETNAAFASMPMTWGQVWTGLINTIQKASEPILKVINAIANNMDTLKPIFIGVATAIGVYAAAMAIYNAVTWLSVAANRALTVSLLANPIMWIAIAIGVIIGLIVKWVQSIGGLKVAWLTVVDVLLYAWETVKIGFMTGVYAVLNFLGQMVLKFQSTGVAIANFMGDTKVAVLTIFQSMVNGAIDILNGLISAVNKIPGVEIDAIEHVTFAADAAIQNEAAKSARAAYLAAAQADLDAAAQERADKLAEMTANRDSEHAQRLAEIETLKLENAQNGTDNSTYDIPTYEEMGGMQNSLDKIGGSVSNIEKSVKMSDEDLKSLVDMAERRYVNKINLTAQTPVINIRGANTGNTAADRKELADAIQTILMEQLASTSFRATAIPT